MSKPTALIFNCDMPEVLGYRVVIDHELRHAPTAMLEEACYDAMSRISWQPVQDSRIADAVIGRVIRELATRAGLLGKESTLGNWPQQPPTEPTL